MKVLLYGASGHGRVVADILLSSLSSAQIVGFVDDDQAKQCQQVGQWPVLGNSDLLPELLARGVTGALATIGSNEVRLAKVQCLTRVGFEIVTVIHPSAVVAPDVGVGAGTVIMAGVVVNGGARIGRSAIINTGATVDHDCVLEDAVHISPGAHLAGHVYVGARAHVGIGSCIIQNIRIGEDAVIGAGAVVIRDVPPKQMAIGNPARLYSRNATEVRR